MTDEQLDERMREAFADARLPEGKLAQLVAQAEPLTERRGWDRWLVGLAVAAALALAVWPTVSHQVWPDVGSASLAPAEDAPVRRPQTPVPVAAPVIGVPSGQRAILVPVATALERTVFDPGTRVDVLVSLDEEPVETVRLLEALVLAVDDAQTARLAVSPTEAEKVAHGVNVGTVQLAAHLDSRLNPTGDAGAPWRALTVPVPAEELRSGFLAPRARVDVLVTLVDGDGVASTRTFLKDARVLETHLSQDADGSHSAAATLVVTAGEAELLAHAAHLGTLSFTRR